LREAITAANTTSNGLDRDEIHFAISGAGVHTIRPSSALPTITDPVTVDGWTQPGFSGSPIIELDGTISNEDGITIMANNSTVRGLVINRFPNHGILLVGGVSGNRIVGNFVGTDVTGTLSLGNAGVGVYMFGGASYNIIGGTTPADRNVVSGNRGTGVVMDGRVSPVNGNQVLGNFIGTNALGTSALPNLNGGLTIAQGASDNSVGGTTPGAGNLISGNAVFGVVIAHHANEEIPDTNTTRNVVQGNLIGTDVTGAPRLGNGGHGVLIFNNAFDNLIGGAASGAGNVIAGNQQAGIAIFDAVNFGAGVFRSNANTIQSNSIHSNGGLGIDLVPGQSNGTPLGDGVTPNDPGDGDSGPNGLQNFPEISSAKSQTGSTTWVFGSLNSLANTSFTLDFYANATADPSGHGEGQRYLGSATATTNASGDATFSVTLAAATSPGEMITATATDPNGDTSEFSLANQVTVVDIQPPPDGTVVEQPDPCDTTKTALVVGGTAGNDQIVISTAANPGELKVTINGAAQNFAAPASAPFGRIVVFGKAGQDDIQVVDSIALSAELHGDSADDRIKGGGGDDILLGGDGDDLLVGGGGRDLLVGGIGRDRMVGNADDDILIAGTTDFDANEQALCDIMKEWTRSDATYAQRVSHLRGDSGEGLNGSTKLIFDGPAATVHDDHAEDILTGSSGQDWFLLNSDGGIKDRVTDLHALEFANDIDFITGP
jgi:hypothetical protein